MNGSTIPRSQNWPFKLLLCFLVILCTSFRPAQADVILHAFNWKYSDVAANADEIAKSGYKMVLVSPPLKSSGDEWWARYQPQDYRVIDNPLGNTHDFKAMIKALNSKNIAVYADIVLNHMANEAGKRPDLNYPGEDILRQYASNPNHYESLKLFGNLGVNQFSAQDFQNPIFSGSDAHSQYCIRDYSNRWQVQHGRLCGAAPDPGLPDLTTNNWVIEQQQLYLKKLKAMGIRGFRVDAAKHMTNEHINRVFTPDIKNGMHIFGEIITQGGAGTSEYDTFLIPYLNQTGHGAYDFPLFSSIFNAFRPNGSMKALVDPLAYGQALQSERAVSFVTTHDIPNNDGFRYLIMDPTDEKLGYAYIMGRDGGVPMVFSDHNESADKHPEDKDRWKDVYKSKDLIAMTKFHNSVQGQAMKMIAYNDCSVLFTRGNSDAKGIVGINKCGYNQSFQINTEQNKFFWFKNYTDVLNPASDKVKITGKNYQFTIPARSAKMWLVD